MSATQRIAQERVEGEVDQIVSDALERHEQLLANAPTRPTSGTAVSGTGPPAAPTPAARPARPAPSSAGPSDALTTSSRRRPKALKRRRCLMPLSCPDAVSVTWLHSGSAAGGR
jgi:hypothetical protein